MSGTGLTPHEIGQLLVSGQCARGDCALCPEDELDFGCSHICHGPDDSEDEDTAMSEQPATTAVTLARLEGMIRDLDGYIEARAREIAQPVIGRAIDDATRSIANAEFETERQKALVAELRKQLEVARRESK